MNFRRNRTIRKANRITRRIYRGWLGKNVTVNVGGRTVVSDTLLGFDVKGDRLVLHFAGTTVTNIAGGQPPTHIWCDDVRVAA